MLTNARLEWNGRSVPLRYGVLTPEDKMSCKATATFEETVEKTITEEVRKEATFSLEERSNGVALRVAGVDAGPYLLTVRFDEDGQLYLRRTRFGAKGDAHTEPNGRIELRHE